MDRLTNPDDSVSALQDFQRRMNGLRDAPLDTTPQLRRAIERFETKHWLEIADDLRHTVGCVGWGGSAGS